MRERHRLWSIVGLALVALLAFAMTGARADEFCAKGGLGASRMAVANADAPAGPPGPDPIGGMGGTGISAALAPGEEAAVVGTITRFGSVCVNGEHVRYQADTPTTRDGAADSARTLQLGQVVRLQIHRDDDGDLVARRITVVDAVAGPVTERDDAGRWFAVMGRRVRLGPDTMFGNAGPAVPELGARVIASGIARNDGSLVTTRVQSGAPGAEAFVAGMVTELDGRMLEVEGVAVRFAEGALPEGLEIGMDVAIRGTWVGDRLDAEELIANPLFTVDRSPALVSVEGYLDRCADPGGHAIGGLAVRLPADATPDAWIGRRVIGVGRPASGAGLVLESLRASPLADIGDASSEPDPGAAVRRPVRICRPIVAAP